MTSLRQGIASMRKKIRSAPDQQQHYLSTMISSDKGPAPIRKTARSAPTNQQDYIAMDAGGSKLAAALEEPNEDYGMFTGDRKSAVKGPTSVKKEGYYWMCTGDQKSVKQEGGYWVRIGELKPQLPLRRKADGRAKGFCADHRKLCISIGIIVGLIVLAGSAIGTYFIVFAQIPSTTRSTLSPLNEDGLLAYEAICVPQRSISSPRPGVNWEECIMGPAPRHDSCSGTATCTFYEYQANWTSSIWRKIIVENNTVNIPMKYDKELVSKPKKSATQLLCRTTSYKLGLCNGSTCTGARVEDKRSWHEESKWEDNCGEPNPCWTGDAIGALSQNPVTRTECLNMERTACNRAKHIAVIVWMQHFRCDSGEDRSRKAPCSGLPYKLWVCTICNRLETSMDFAKDQCNPLAALVTHDCTVWCALKGLFEYSYFTLEDGAACFNSPSGPIKTGYCFKGGCFDNFTVLNDENRHELEKTGCRNKKQK